MKAMKKSEKVIRWASEQKVRPVDKMAKELRQSPERTRAMLNGLQRKGLITLEKITGERGREWVAMHLTQVAYYNRSVLVNAR